MVSGCKAKDIETFLFEYLIFKLALYFKKEKKKKKKKGLYLDDCIGWLLAHVVRYELTIFCLISRSSVSKILRIGNSFGCLYFPSTRFYPGRSFPPMVVTAYIKFWWFYFVY
jgi:hypothetical protein